MKITDYKIELIENAIKFAMHYRYKNLDSRIIQTIEEEELRVEISKDIFQFVDDIEKLRRPKYGIFNKIKKFMRKNEGKNETD